MHPYVTLDTDHLLDNQTALWKSRLKPAVAMDFEGEFNLHVYGEHLCLIQLFDRQEFFIIDPFKVSADALRRFLEEPSIEKIMFDCASDAALVRKQYNIQIAAVHDVRLSAMVLGFTGNLDGLKSRSLGREAATGKKRNQTANWMVRPLHPRLIEYALADVEDLFELKEALLQEAGTRNLMGQVLAAQEKAALPKGPERPGYEKLDGYRYLTQEQKTHLRWFFESRDMLARNLNVPAVRVLEKSKLIELAKHVPRTEQALRSVVRHRDRTVEDALVALFTVAREGADKEVSHG